MNQNHKNQLKIMYHVQTPAVIAYPNSEQIVKFLEFCEKIKKQICGLAANQLCIENVPFEYAMIAIKINNKFRVYIQPEIIETYGKEVIKIEKCVSWPNSHIVAKRYLKIKVKYYDIFGVLIEDILEGDVAQIFQHEYNHITGVPEDVQSGTQHMNPNKIGRNDTCPCGSNKKYKKCCGA